MCDWLLQVLVVNVGSYRCSWEGCSCCL